MGFKPKKTIYTLDFQNLGDDFEGLQVRTGMLSLGAFLKISSLVDTPAAQMTEGDVDELFGQFAGILLDWNIEDDDDKPVPATKEGLYSLEFPFTMRIILTWRDAMKGVADDDPLAGDSDSGATSLEESMPMESLSGNRAS